MSNTTQRDVLRHEGRLGSTKEVTWTGDNHICCGSKRAYYHSKMCPRVVSKQKDSGGSLIDESTGNEIRYNKHPKKKNNVVVSAMYAMYKSGKSLEQVGERYGKTRQTVYDVFRSRGYPLRSKQLKGLQVLDGYRFTLTKGGYLRGSVEGKRITMHKYVWEKHNSKLPFDHVIFHLDRNRENNSIENLRIVHKSKMAKTFNPNGNNQFTKF